jgi:hypothetical protein
VPKAWCVHKARQVITEYRDYIVLVYFVNVIVLSQYRTSNFVNVIVLSQYRTSNFQHVRVVQPCGNCSLDVLKILEIKASHWPLLSPFILTMHKRKVIHARYSDWTEILCETVFPQIDSSMENIKHIFYLFVCTTVGGNITY